MDFSSKQGKRFYAKKRRRRTIISSKDLEKLEGLFKISKWPDRIQKGRLSKAIGKSENFISTWFQNRRARMRRLARQKDLLDEVDTSDSNVQSSDTLHHKLHKYRIKSHSYKIVREEATNHVGHVHERQPKRARETTDVDVPEGLKTSLEGIDLNAELKEQEIKSHDRTKSGNTLGRQFSTEKAIVKMKKAPNDVVSKIRMCSMLVHVAQAFLIYNLFFIKNNSPYKYLKTISFL